MHGIGLLRFCCVFRLMHTYIEPKYVHPATLFSFVFLCYSGRCGAVIGAADDEVWVYLCMRVCLTQGNTIGRIIRLAVRPCIEANYHL